MVKEAIDFSILNNRGYKTPAPGELQTIYGRPIAEEVARQERLITQVDKGHQQSAQLASFSDTDHERFFVQYSASLEILKKYGVSEAYFGPESSANASIESSPQKTDRRIKLPKVGFNGF